MFTMLFSEHSGVSHEALRCSVLLGLNPAFSAVSPNLSISY